MKIHVEREQAGLMWLVAMWVEGREDYVFRGSGATELAATDEAITALVAWINDSAAGSQ